MSTIIAFVFYRVFLGIRTVILPWNSQNTLKNGEIILPTIENALNKIDFQFHLCGMRKPLWKLNSATGKFQTTQR